MESVESLEARIPRWASGVRRFSNARPVSRSVLPLLSLLFQMNSAVDWVNRLNANTRSARSSGILPFAGREIVDGWISLRATPNCTTPLRGRAVMPTPEVSEKSSNPENHVCQVGSPSGVVAVMEAQMFQPCARIESMFAESIQL